MGNMMKDATYRVTIASGGKTGTKTIAASKTGSLAVEIPAGDAIEVRIERAR